MFRNISTQFALMAVAVVVCTAGTIGILQYLHITRYQMERETERLTFVVERSAQELQVIEEARRKVLFLAETPPIGGIIRATQNDGLDVAGNSTTEVWKDRLANIFRSMAERNPDLLQIRLIGKANGGKEIVRVDRDGPWVHQISEHLLQQKGDRDYVRETLAAQPGAVLTYGIDLNREHGRVVEPHEPVLRVASPVADENGVPFGVIIINVRMGPVLDRLAQSFGQDRVLYLTNSNGDFLVHPDRTKTFGFDLGNNYRLQDQYPELAGFFKDEATQSETKSIKDADGAHFVYVAKIGFDTAKPDKFLMAAVFSPMSRLVAERLTFRNRILLISSLLAIIGAAIAVLFTRHIVKPIEALTAASDALADGVPIQEIEIPVDRQDGVGKLARSFQSMATTVQVRQASLLQEKDASIRAILEAAASPIITIDHQGLVLDANPATSQLFGYSRDELIGSNVSVLMTDQDRNHHDQYLENYRKGSKPKIIGIGREVEGQRKDGTKVPLHLAVSEYKLKGKTLFTGIITDMTEQKKIDKLKNEFVSTVSHELRTPLTSIKGSLGLLQSNLLGELPEQAKSMITIAHSNSDRLVRLINDILDIEKIEAGKLSFTFQKTELGPFLTRTIEVNRSYAHDLGVDIELVPVDEDLYVESDPDRLTQVMTNLLSNAAKFSPKGTKIEVGATTTGNIVRITVTDHGPGIPENFQQKIFSKFAQADSSDTKAQGGTGLGLAITKAIVEAHGGTIGFETYEGAGTTFYFDMPLLETVTTPAFVGPDGGKPKILICEDDVNTAELLRLIIAELGYDTEICTNAGEAKRRVLEGTFAAMTLDIGLPGQSGISLIREFRQAPETQDFPIVVVSAGADDARKELNGAAVSVIDWLEKPIDSKFLREGITRAARSFNANALRILHVEDDEDHVHIVRSLVRTSDHIDRAQNCQEALKLLAENDYDLVILDLQLPDGRGEDLLPSIHSNGTTTPQVLVYSIDQVEPHFRDGVDGSLVKSQTSNEAVRRQIEGLLTLSVKADSQSTTETQGTRSVA